MARRKNTKRVPRQLPPDAIRRSYTRELTKIANRNRRAMAPVIKKLSERMDGPEEILAAKEAANFAKEIDLMVKAAKRAAAMPAKELSDLAKKFAKRTAKFQKGELLKQVFPVLGIDPFVSEPYLAPLIDGWVAQNVALIKDIPIQTMDKIGKTLNDGIKNGKLHGSLADDIEKHLGYDKTRAKLIARDQVGKFYGAVNSERQQEIGVESFIWETVGDSRVRSEHDAIQGNVYTWKKGAPGEGIPGEPVLCRCYGSPVISRLADL